MDVKNLLSGIPRTLPTEVVEVLAASQQVRIERIVSTGQASPEDFWYDQPQAEFVLVVSGAGRLCFEDSAELVEMRPGDWIVIAAHRRHRVEWTSPGEPTVWLAVHFGELP